MMRLQPPDGEIGNAVYCDLPYVELRVIEGFQSPDGEIGNAVSIMLNFVNNFEEKVSVP